MRQKRVRFRGMVQGVGFRYTAVQIARGFAVDGFVSNCPDGSVDLVAEGEPKELAAFLSALRGRMGQYIRDMKEQDAPATGQFSDFTVHY